MNIKELLDKAICSVLKADHERCAQLIDERAAGHRKTLEETAHCDHVQVWAALREAEKCAAAIRALD